MFTSPPVKLCKTMKTQEPGEVFLLMAKNMLVIESLLVVWREKIFLNSDSRHWRIQPCVLGVAENFFWRKWNNHPTNPAAYFT
jgi:hypothetical protein